MRILLIGGYGFLGGRLARYLSSFPECKVVIGSSRQQENILLYPQCAYAKVCWDDFAELQKICEGVDVVIHAAGINAEDSAKDPVLALKMNGVNTAQLVQAAISKKVKRIVYFSTAHVYSSPLTGVIDETYCPSNFHPYATSHKAAEDVIRYANARKQIEGVIIRLSNSFGYPVDLNANCWMLFVNNLCLQEARTGTIIIKSSATQRRNFIPLTEVCFAVHHLITLDNDLLGDGVFNIGSYWNPTLEEVALMIGSIIAEESGGNYRLLLNNSPHEQQAKEGVTLDYSINKLAATGYVPRMEAIEFEIRELLRFCRQNKDKILFEA